MSEPVPSLNALLEKQAEAMMSLAVAVNRQTQAILELASATRQLVDSASASGPVPDDGEEDRDHIPTHDLGGQPIHVR